MEGNSTILTGAAINSSGEEVFEDRHAVVHVLLGEAEYPYFTNLFSYKADVSDVEVRGMLKQYKNDGLVHCVSIASDDEILLIAKKKQYKGVVVETTLTNNTDKDFKRLFNIISKLKDLEINRITILFDGEDKIRLCHLYNTAMQDIVKILPPEGKADQKMELSVCIPTYNRKEILLRCLTALDENYRELIKLNPDLREKVEIIIVDDQSSDGTVGAVFSIKDNLSYKIKVESIANSGPAAARNRAVQVSEGKIIIFIDDDKIVKKNFLLHHYKFHASHSDMLDVCLGFVDWPNYIEKTFLMEHVVSEFGGQQFGYAVVDRYKKNNLPYDYFVTANISMKKQLLTIYGGFHEQIFRDAMWEDIELGWRFKEVGMKLHYVSDATVYHDHYMTLVDFAKRQYKVGQYVSRLRNYPFMEKYRMDESLFCAIPMVNKLSSRLANSDLLILTDYIKRNETDLLQKYGRMKMHNLYNTILGVAYLYGIRNPMSPLSSSFDSTKSDQIITSLMEMLLPDEPLDAVVRPLYGVRRVLSAIKRRTVRFITGLNER